MKRHLSIVTLCLAVTFLFWNCQSDLNETMQQVASIETQPDLVKKYVEENSYIEIDVSALAKEIAKAQTTRSVSVDQDKVAQMKAALYRFYSNVELVNDTYVCKLTSAKDINVSADVYKALLDNLNEMNTAIQEAKKNGKEVVIPQVDKTYLESLLK